MTIQRCINISLVAVFLLKSTIDAQSTNPICYVCGGDPAAIVQNPDVLIDIPPELNSAVPQASCQQIYQAGLDELITVEQCDAILSMVEAQTLCGCSNIVAPIPTPASIPTPSPGTATVPVPVNVPAPVAITPQVVVPTDPPVEIPTNLETDPPGTLMPNPVDAGVTSPTECEGKGKGGKGKGESSSSGKGKDGMMMGKKCKKPKVPKTPKAGKGMDGKGKGKGESLRI